MFASPPVLLCICWYDRHRSKGCFRFVSYTKKSWRLKLLLGVPHGVLRKTLCYGPRPEGTMQLRGCVLRCRWGDVAPQAGAEVAPSLEVRQNKTLLKIPSMPAKLMRSLSVGSSSAK